MTKNVKIFENFYKMCTRVKIYGIIMTSAEKIAAIERSSTIFYAYETRQVVVWI